MLTVLTSAPPPIKDKHTPPPEVFLVHHMFPHPYSHATRSFLFYTSVWRYFRWNPHHAVQRGTSIIESLLQAMVIYEPHTKEKAQSKVQGM